MSDKNAIIREAQKYLSKGQVDKAIAEWDKLIKEAPDGNVYNIIGDLYLKNADKKNAIDSFLKAADFFRKDGFALKAMALYKKVLNINPSDSGALLAIGELNEEKGLSTDAIKYYLASADSFSKEGKKDRVHAIYEKIISMSPENILLGNKIAEIYLKEGLKSNAATEYVRIARTCDEKGDLEKAREYYKKALDIQPLDKAATIGIGDIYEKSGRHEEAIGHMRHASTLFAGDVDILFKCSEFLRAGGDDESAKDCLNKIRDLDPENIRARSLMGEIYLKAGATEQAWEEYRPAIDAMILDEKYETAIKLLGPFREIDPLETGKRLVSLYRQIGETDHVVEELVRLGDAMKERDMNDNALTCYKDALELMPEDSRLQELVRGPVKEAVNEPESEVITVHVPEMDKTVEEIFIETDIFSRYGLLSEAIKLLEGLKIREPQNIDLHIRLKSLYSDSGDKELAVSECLVLTELYKRLGDIENSDKMLQEAFEISPEDPRLAERGLHPLYESTSHEMSKTEGFEAAPEEKPDIEDYDEEIAEADFYSRQGLTQEAAKILEKLHKLFPENKDIIDKMDNLGQVLEETEEEIQPGGEVVGEEADLKDDIREEIVQPEKTGYEDFTLSDQDLVDAQEMPEPALDDDVLSIFHEFKKGLEKELGDEDSETHYNLGIAYKEMGLIDDAIQEFQTARNDPKRLVQSSTMLGVCYMEKGMYSLAIEALNNVLNKIGEDDEAYWPLRYDLADAYEKNNDLSRALELYTGVYGWNARFRSVAEKISQIRSAGIKEAAKEKEKPKERKDRVSYL